MARIIGHAMMVVGQDLTAVDGPSTVGTANGLGQRNAVGVRAFDDAGNEYVYAPGVASLIAGDFVIFSGSGLTPVRLLNDANSGGAGRIAVAMGAFVASTWGWYAIYGNIAAANVATQSAPTTPAALYRTGTTARANITAVAKDGIFGAFLVGASVANLGAVDLSYPFVMDQSTL